MGVEGLKTTEDNKVVEAPVAAECAANATLSREGWRVRRESNSQKRWSTFRVMREPLRMWKDEKIQKSDEVRR